MSMRDLDECVLIIESDSAAATLIRASLVVARDGPFSVDRVANLREGMEWLSKRGAKAILLNLFLSDSQGIETFNKLYAISNGIPILIMSAPEQEEQAKLAILGGAQDYLLTGFIDAHSLSRAIRNVMARQLVEEELYLEKERAQVTLNSIGDAVISTDISGTVTYLNVVAERMTGWTQAEAVGQPFTTVFRIVDGITRETLRNPMDRAIKENKPVGLTIDSVLIRRDGYEAAIEDSAAPIRDRGGRVTGAVIVFHDVSEARSMLLKMAHLAQHDFLTDLPNRLLLNDRLMQTIAMARRTRKQLAVLFMDLDRFKTINDSLGHLVGDKLLQSVAHRLTACVRGSDTVSRQGGDEFIVLLADVENANAAGHSATKILTALAENHCIAEHDLNVTLSIGISIFPDDGEDAETLLKNADAAMYHAKENGRNNYQFFKQEMNERAVERQSLEGSLRQALARQEFVLHYQPKVNLKTGAITGAEALIRWKHPVRGLLYPKQFVPIAEETGLIVSIGQWVLREACRQAKAWQDDGHRPIPVAVNISAVEFRREQLLAEIKDILRDTGLEPRYLEIELTESVLVHDIASTMTALLALKVLGVQLAIDDFGTGYSSLSYLRQFPIDTLKIDQSFVHDIAAERTDVAIVSAVIGLGNSLKLRVIAEGVETGKQLAFLQTEHCEEGQGFYFSHPVDANAFVKLLGKDNTDYTVN
ncbi:EAL domain-containing protein [Sulfuriferula thiophila]|uniref:EAL domain-containing protein n=1 Tax=Sulfuriferula thiophila TaxID=1781211 RepID=UPI001678D6C1|nr:EAL domain-containing protein [Sulfuriferula thiophila]